MKSHAFRPPSSVVRAALVPVLCVVLSATAPLTQSLERSQENGSTGERVDVAVFGATPAGVTAAVSAARAGLRVRLVEPGTRVGGMVSGGLSNTDTGPRGPEVISGLTGEFFARVRKIEQARGVCIKSCESSYFFEPHVAEQVFEGMIREAGVVLDRSVQLLKVEKQGATITRLITSRGDLRASVVIDASYEGDLMALASVPYQNAASGTIAFIEPRPERLPEPGEGDSRVTAYTYRLCVTDDPANRIPFSQPENYTASDFEVHARLAAAALPGVDIVRSMFNPSPMVLSRDPRYFKYDLNSTLNLSTDLTADTLNQAYVESPPARRLEIQRTYRRYIQGVLWAWQTEPRFGPLRERVSRFGYCADEFKDDGGWPHQFYVRVGRRMLGEYVMNENDVMRTGRRDPIRDPITLGTYALAAHAHRYLAAPVEWPGGVRKDAVVLEGTVITRLPDVEPYPISYRAITPRESDARNLLNPVTLSATSIAYSAIRMEPTFMMLGEAAGTAAALSIKSNVSVQAVDYASLRQRLTASGVRLAR